MPNATPATPVTPVSTQVSQSGTNYIVIGKIPGYNKNINSKLLGSEDGKTDYTQRLRHNLTTIKLRPTGYKINFESMNPFSGSTPSSADATNTTNVVQEGLDKTLYAVGGEVTLGFGNLVDNSSTTLNALNSWLSLVRVNINETASQNVNELRILATNDSTMSEVFSNQFDMSTAEKMANKIGESALGQVFQTLKKAVTVDSSMGLSMLQNGSGLTENQFLNMLGGKALGVQTALPREWFKSDYNNSLQLMIKLISPAGDENSIKEYILKPLMFLILAVSPVTYDGINYGYPTLWEVEADGLMDIKLAGISSLIITRGGTDTQFNRHNQPMNVDVRLTIEPLIHGFATPMKNINSSAFLVTNPTMLKKSMEKDTESEYKSIKL